MLLNYIHWDVNPEMINLFGVISLRYYSVLFGLGLIVAYYIMLYLYKKQKLPIANLDKLFVYVFVGTVVGARLGHCFFYEPMYYITHPLEMLLPFQGTIGKDFHFTGYQGLASHGGALGILLSIVLYSKRFKVNIWSLLDKIAVVVPIAGASIRLGNLMNSEIIGHTTDVPWAFIFSHVDGMPRHPAQLYEAIAYIFIFVIMISLYEKQFAKRQNGFFFGVFLILLFLARMIIEFFKMNQVPFEDGLLFNMGQSLSIPFVIAGIWIVVQKSLITDNK